VGSARRVASAASRAGTSAACADQFAARDAGDLGGVSRGMAQPNEAPYTVWQEHRPSWQRTMLRDCMGYWPSKESRRIYG